MLVNSVFWLTWPWPWPDDLDIRTWPRYSEDVPPYQKQFLGQGFSKLDHEQNRHTQRDRERERGTRYRDWPTRPKVVPSSSQVVKIPTHCVLTTLSLTYPNCNLRFHIPVLYAFLLSYEYPARWAYNSTATIIHNPMDFQYHHWRAKLHWKFANSLTIFFKLHVD